MKALFYIIIGLYVGFTAGFYSGMKHPNSASASSAVIASPPSIPTPVSTLDVVKRVIDGDTIVLENGKKVRYIGVDAPEMKGTDKQVECFAQEATQQNKNLVEGKRVRLEKDVSETDRYGRLLRYVYVVNEASQEAFVQAELLKDGYVVASRYPPDVKENDYFRELELQARGTVKGLWRSCQTSL